jgi:hypothetical protein
MLTSQQTQKLCLLCNDKYYSRGFCKKHYYQIPEIRSKKNNNNNIFMKQDRINHPEKYNEIYVKNNYYRSFRSFWKRVERTLDRCIECGSQEYVKNFCKRCYKRIQARKYYKINPKKYVLYSKAYQKKHPEKKKTHDKKYRQSHRLEHNANQRLLNKRNPEKKRMRNQRWIDTHHEQYMRISRRNYDKLRMQYKEFGYEQSYPKLNTLWRLLIRNKDDNICKVCGDKGVNAHHLLYQRFFPKLAFNENNGITLCQRCHLEVHGKKLLTPLVIKTKAC